MVECEECSVWQHIYCILAGQGIAPDDVDIEEWQAQEFVCDNCRVDKEATPEDDEEFVLDAPQAAMDEEEEDEEEDQGADEDFIEAIEPKPIKIVMRGNPPMIQLGSLAQLEQKRNILRSILASANANQENASVNGTSVKSETNDSQSVSMMESMPTESAQVSLESQEV